MALFAAVVGVIAVSTYRENRAGRPWVPAGADDDLLGPRRHPPQRRITQNVMMQQCRHGMHARYDQERVGRERMPTPNQMRRAR